MNISHTLQSVPSIPLSCDDTPSLYNSKTPNIVPDTGVILIRIKPKPHKNNICINTSKPPNMNNLPNSSTVTIQESRRLKEEVLSPYILSDHMVVNQSTRFAIAPEQSTHKKTHKKKTTISQAEKSRLWDIFDTEKNTPVKQSTPTEIECIYEHKEPGLCHLCSSVLVIAEDGFPTCTNSNCAVIYTDTLDYSPEWRFYGADDKNAADPTRCGNPINPLLVESSFGCKVMASSNLSYEMKKIRKWTEWQSMPHKEKSLYNEFQFITIMAQNAGIPKILIDDAISIHKDISEQKMFRGLNRDGIKAASIYISCRLNGCPRTAHEIAEIFNLDKTSATNGCSMAVNILHNIERDVDVSQQTELQMTTPSSFIDRYCSKLNMNTELTMLCKFIANKLEQNNIITDNTPHAIAAGIVYFISFYCNLNITKTNVKAISGVSDVTINKCFKKMDAIRDTLLPQCIVDKYL
jgi:transcription initiation factor TFIIB